MIDKGPSVLLCAAIKGSGRIGEGASPPDLHSLIISIRLVAWSGVSWIRVGSCVQAAGGYSLIKDQMTKLISTRSIPELVLDQLRNRILHGKLQSGEPLRIDALASELGISHMPVREALHVLIMEGLAVRLPRRGVVVSSIGPHDIEQAYLTLAAIEGEAARAAAEHITDEHIERLRAAVITSEHQAGLNRRLAANRSLHDVIDAIAPNRWRDGFAERLRNFIYRMRHVHQPSAERQVEVASEHAALINALAARDAAGAERCARVHNMGACADLLRQMGRP